MSQSKQFELAGISWEVRMLDPDEQIEVECILLRVLGPAVGASASSLVQGAAPALVEMLRGTVADTGHAERVLDSLQESLAILCPAATVSKDGDAVLVLYFETADAAAGARPLVEAEIESLMDIDETAPADALRLVLSRYVVESANQPFELARLLELDTADPRLSGAWSQLLDALSATAGEVVSDGLAMLSGRLDHRDIKRLFDLVILGPNKTTIRKGDQVAKVASYPVLGELLQRDPRAKWSLLKHGLLATYARPVAPEPDEVVGDA